MNRIATTSAAVLLAATSSIALTGSAFACETTVDPFTGTLVCADTSQPVDAGLDAPSPWLGIAVGVALVVAAVLLLVRRPAKRAPAQPQAKLAYPSGFSTAGLTDTHTRLAELEADLQDERHENERLRSELQALRTV
jgi:hypothetical protein